MNSGYSDIQRAAPHSLQAWTDSASLQQWMGTRGFTATSLDRKSRRAGNGGPAYIVMNRAQGCGESAGDTLCQSGRYLEVSEPERLVLKFQWEDRTDIPCHETVITLIFTEQHGQTTMIFHQAFFESTDVRDGHSFGWSSSFDRLETALNATN
jgi:uncharacterized protein YndB with AHSA1/START domain